MRNKKTLKIILYLIIGVIIATWLIPGSRTSEGALSFIGITPIGLGTFLQSIEVVFYNIMLFVFAPLTILMVGAFYGVLNKTGAYYNLVKYISEKFKKQRWIVLVFSIVFFILIPSLTNIHYAMLIFIPLFMSVLYELKFPKKTIILATAGSVLIGLGGALFEKGYSTQLGIENNYLLAKIIFLVLSLVATIVFSYLTSKKPVKEEKPMLLTPRKEESPTRSLIPMIVILGIVLVFVILGMTAWKTDVFTNMYQKIMDVKISEYPIFNNIFKPFAAFGNWGYLEIIALLSFAILMLKGLYKIKFEEMFKSMFEGIKEVLPIVLIVFFLNIIVVMLLNTGVFNTILYFLSKEKTGIIVAFLASPLMIAKELVVEMTLPDVAALLSGKTESLPLVFQFMFNLSSLIIPTSAMLLTGLMIADEDYGNWFKYIIKIGGIIIAIAFIILSFLP